ncbi:probable aquaporin NIP-type [Aristolochia californica]|uniref:probable aquaporin NIP-type n=1 Tax=Aristolochia californica TaxID=171875 RepID=UPI0035DBA351
MAEERIDVVMENPGDSTNDQANSSWSSPSSATLHLLRKCFAELFATYFVVFSGCGSVAVNKIYGSVTFPGVCLTWGLIVMAMIYSTGHISGAHFNPAVTLTFAIINAFQWREVIPYWVAQFLGSVLASGTLRLILSSKTDHFFGTLPVGSDIQSLVAEFVISFLLMFVICGASADDRAIGQFGGLAIGSTITLNLFVAGPVSGASMNPARSLGPALVMNEYRALWVYIVGPFAGVLAGALVYNLIKIREPTKKEPLFDSKAGEISA